MRLSQHQKTSILSVLSPHGRPFLYGSRVDDQLKGGDIDLLLLVSEESIEGVKTLKYQLLSKIEEKIGEQKIDLVLATKDTLKQDPFLSSVASKMVPL